MSIVATKPAGGYREAGSQQLDFGFVAPTCAHTGGTDVRWHKWVRGGGWHLGRFCVTCGRWLNWQPQTPEVLAWAPPRPVE